MKQAEKQERKAGDVIWQIYGDFSIDTPGLVVQEDVPRRGMKEYVRPMPGEKHLRPEWLDTVYFLLVFIVGGASVMVLAWFIGR